MSIEVINGILKRALDGEVSSKLNESEVSDEFKKLVPTINQVIERLGDAAEAKKLQKRANAFLQDNPQGITILAPDKHRLDLNKEYERIWRGSYDELMAKKLYDFNINITGGDDFYASYETKKRAVTDMEISWENGEKSYLRLFQTPILDENGEIDVNYYIYQDLTPQMEKMNEIKNLEEQSNAIVEENPMPILLWNTDLTLRKHNKAFVKLSGYSESEAENLTMNDFRYLSQSGKSVLNTIEDKKASHGEAEIEFPSGVKTLERYNIPLMNEDGSVDSVMSVYNDITVLKQEMEETKRLQKRADAFLKLNPQGITVLADDKHRLDLNKEYERIWHGSYDELMAKKLYDFNINIVGGDDFYASYETKKPAVTDMEIEWDNDEKTYLRLFQTPILDENGEIDVNYYIYQDLTDQHREMAEIAKLQRRADAFLQQNPQAITALAPDKHRLDLNKEYERVWRGSYNELMAKKLYDFNINITGGDDFYASYETKKRAVTEMEISWENGQKSYLRLFQTPILDENGEIDVNYYIYQDMTPEVTLSNYMNDEVDRISANLEKLAKGNLDMNLEAAPANEFTTEARKLMNQIDKSLGEAKIAIEALVADSEMLAEAAVNGELDTRSDIGRHDGQFRQVVEGINNTLDTIALPLNEAIRVIGEYAENNYTDSFNEKVVVKGEFEKFRESINMLGQNTSNTIGDVIGAVDHVFVGTNEASKGSDEVARAAEQVAMTSQKCADISKEMLDKMTGVQQQIADLSASNEEIAATSQDVLKNSEEVTKVGKDAQVLGNDANRKMAAVEEITNRSAEEIKELNNQIKEINNIVKMINDITSQINLLALNAAIEAARAGEHGRGFAVVAGEVKNLAADARKATEHIDKVIGEIQNNSIRTADAIQSASNEVVSGVESVDAAIRALNNIVEGAEHVTMNMSEIAKAIEDQANIANNVVTATDEGSRLAKDNLKEVEELAALAEEASASTEEIGSAIHEVNNMSQKLQNNMKAFKIKK